MSVLGGDRVGLVADRTGETTLDGDEGRPVLGLPEAPALQDPEQLQEAPELIPAGGRRPHLLPAPPLGARDEVSIMREAAAGDAGAVRVLLDVHLPTVYGFVRARLGGGNPSVDDVMQETLEEAVKSARTFRGESSLATWLCAIARRRLARHYERERRSEEAGRWEPSGREPPEDALDRRDEVVRALAKLPPSQREALTLKYLDDMTVEQVATHMQKSTVKVQSILQRARDGLKKELERVRG
jgi:RNA polymerase sigma-70 factor, ECF subfamily